MMLAKRLKDTLVEDEALVLHAYPDSRGILTLGVGRRIDEKGGISKEEAFYMLDNDVWQVINEVNAAFPWFKSLSEDRQIVICSMRFNLGMAGLFGFKKMLAALKKGDFREARVQMLDSDWKDQVGERADRLADLMYPEHPLSYEEGGA